MFDMPDTNQSEIVNRENARMAGCPAADLAAKLADVSQMPYDDLRAEWRRLYRSQPPKRVSRELLELGIAWKLQERTFGGLGPSLTRRLADLSQTMENRGDLAKARLLRLKPDARLLPASRLLNFIRLRRLYRLTQPA